VEHELYNYEETKLEIGRLKEEIINTPPTPIHERTGAQKTGVSDPTNRKTEKILSCATIAHMEKTIRVIERALMQLDEIHNEIFELKYRKGRSWQMVIIDMSISQSQYFKKRRELVILVARGLGYI